VFAVTITDLSKKFRIYLDKAPSLKERAIFWDRNRIEDFWALRDINVQIRQGTTVGLIGRNGSGKSTLLKVISRIIYPTSGCLEVNGRVSTLLELGAGFHPDYTGRENIFLNASILGFSRREIKKQLDSIIAFAELGDFIDNPVRNYSSGMYMRLGFSVAVHVEPDILLVDEAMAVGDLAFQKKCLEKIGEFRARGKTIIFVTHDMSLAQRICDEVIWLEHGALVTSGNARDVVNKYLDLVATREEARLLRQHQQAQEKRPAIEEAPAESENSEKKEDYGESVNDLQDDKSKRWGNKMVEITSVKMLNRDAIENYSFECGQPARIVMRYTMHQKIDDLVFGIGIIRDDKVYCYATNTDIEQYKINVYPKTGTIECQLQNLYLLEGRYFLDVAAHTREGIPYDYWTQCLDFSVISRKKDAGITRLENDWLIRED
jgi:ABC-type polysaccharide/polyol phosphate transport system ATPase subunit